MDSLRIVELGNCFLQIGTAGPAGSLWWRPKKGEPIRIAESLYPYPIRDGRRNGCWLKWASGQVFLTAGLLATPKRIVEILLAAGCRVNAAYARQIRDFAATAYAEDTAISISGGAAVPAHWVAYEAEEAEAGRGS